MREAARAWSSLAESSASQPSPVTSSTPSRKAHACRSMVRTSWCSRVRRRKSALLSSVTSSEGARFRGTSKYEAWRLKLSIPSMPCSASVLLRQSPSP